MTFRKRFCSRGSQVISCVTTVSRMLNFFFPRMIRNQVLLNLLSFSFPESKKNFKNKFSFCVSILNIFLFFFFSYRHNQSIQSVRTQTTVKRTPSPARTRQSIIVSLPTAPRSRVANDRKPPVPITSYSSQSLTQSIPLRW